MHAIFLGASQGCGFHTVLNLLKSDQQSQLTLLLRTPERFNESPEIVSLFKSKPEIRNQVQIVKGDALIKEDLEKLFEEAGGEKVEFVMSSLGGAPDFSNPLSPTINPPNITSRAFSNLLPIFQQLSAKRKSLNLPPPRLISVSTTGLGQVGHSDLPFLLRGLYGWLLKVPHQDKFEMERMIFEASGKGNKESGIEEKGNGWLEDFIIIRPSLLTSGDETQNYRVKEKVPSAYSVSRKDVGHFVFAKCMPGSDEFKNRGVTISK